MRRPALHGLPLDDYGVRSIRECGDAWLDYRRVNLTLASALAGYPDDGQPLLVQDYQLLLLPELLRAAQPSRSIALHLHTPFVLGDRWAQLRRDGIGEALLRGMLGANVLSFSSAQWTKAFTKCCSELSDVTVETPGLLRVAGGRTIEVATLPVLSSPGALHRAVQAAQTTVWEDSLGDLSRAVLVVGRVDPAKNLATALRAVDMVLDADATARAVILLVPSSRQHVPEYAACSVEVQQLVDALRGRHPSRAACWMGNDVARAYAAMRRCGVVLIPSWTDGMNLVAQEVVWLTEVDAAVVLASTAGVSDLMGDAAEMLNDPMDVHEMAAAAQRALNLSAEARRARNIAARHALEAAAAPGCWLARQEQLCRN